jgi:hypothetical protein
MAARIAIRDKTHLSHSNNTNAFHTCKNNDFSATLFEQPIIMCCHVAGVGNQYPKFTVKGGGDMNNVLVDHHALQALKRSPKRGNQHTALAKL